MISPVYKVLNEDGSPCNDGAGVWPLPENGQPGAWRSVEPPLRPCEHGLHLCRREDLVGWLGPVIYRAEIHPDAERVEWGDKVVVTCARLLARMPTWTDRVALLFAADCAERALQRERAAGRAPDPRSWAVVEVTRAFAEGRISRAACEAASVAAGQVAGAAWEAAGSAAGGAGWAVAWAAGAAWAAGNAGEAAGVAWEAAWEAGEAALCAEGTEAAEAAARATERQWQTDRLWWYLGERPAGEAGR